MKIKLEEITFDKDIQPRQQVSHKTVDSYVEALKAGAKFPPLKVQKIRVSEEEKEEIRLICLDGKHRYLAFETYNKLDTTTLKDKIREVDVEFWKDEVLDKKDNLNILLLQAASYNKEHGDRLSEEDTSFVARRVAINDPEGKLTEKQIGSYLGRSQEAVSDYITDIRATQSASRDNLIYRLNFLGWTQEEIAEVTGLERSSISKIVKNTNIGKIHNSINEWLSKGKSVEEAAQKLEIDTVLAWAFVLKDKDDLTRMMEFSKISNKAKKQDKDEYGIKQPRAYNVWNFSKRDLRLGKVWPGNIPGQIVVNLLYYYTDQGDLVVDPMAGGGSTVDACLIMGRKCRAYNDITTTETEKMGIVKRDILKEGYAERAKNCKLIFLDPPYWRLKRDEYEEGGTEIESFDGWLSFMEKIAKDSFETVKKEGYTALLLEPFFDRHEEKRFLDLPFLVNQYFLDAGFIEYYRIHAPLPPNSTAHGLKYGKEKKLILDQARDLTIYKKEK